MASESPENKYLYDIIYCDRTRLAPLISQLNAHGLPTDISVSENSGSSGNVKAGGTAGWTFMAEGKASGELSGQIQESISQQTKYDPYWATILSFADQAIGLAKREELELGKLCLISGGLSISDISSLNELMTLKVARDGMIAGLFEDQSGNHKAKKKAALETFELVKEVTNLYSGSVQGILSTDSENSFWMSLDRDFLIFPANEIILKYGHVIPGKWSILGVYDAMPAKTEDAEPAEDGRLSAIAMSIAPAVRQLVGKADEQHSLTPLMIMREI